MNARDYVMARLAATRAWLTGALDALDDALLMFVDPDADESGKERAQLLEAVDDALGEAARAVQLAQDHYDQVDPAECEPDLPEGDGHDVDDEADDD